MTFRAAVYFALQAAVLLVALASFTISLPEPPPTFKLTEAQRLEANSVARPVSLPDLARPARLDDREAVYVAQFLYPGESEPVWSVFLPRFIIDARIAVNGVEIVDSGSGTAASKAQFNLPLISLIPRTVLKTGVNEVTVTVSADPPIAKHLEAIFVGPDEALRSSFNKRAFLFQSLPVVFTAWQFLLALLLFLIWSNRRAELSYGILALAMSCGFTRTVLLDYGSVEAVAVNGALIVFESALIVPFALLLVGRRASPWLALLFLPGVLLLGVGLIDNPLLVKFAFLFFGPPSVIVHVLIISVILARAAIRQGRGVAFLFGAAMSFVLASVVHDVLTILDLLSGTRYVYSGLAYSGILISVGLLLTLHFVQALNRIDNFAAQMVVKIAEAEDKLRQSFAREEMRARAEALAEERDRLMRDLHDGLGGQLVRIVALSEREDGQSGKIGEAARGALKDLRLVIDAMEDVGGDLLLALASWRERTEVQLRVHQIVLHWQVMVPEESLTFPELRPWHVIQIIRVMDEAVTNAVRHSGARTVSVLLRTGVTGEDGHSVHITIRDDGRGFLPGSQESSLSSGGLSNMRKRSALCGVEFTIESDDFGTSIDLRLPDAFPPVPVNSVISSPTGGVWQS